MESKEKLIELHELRIGNLLSYKGEFVHVTSLSRDIDDEYQDIIGFCKIGKNTDEKAGWNRELFNDLKCIPLTPEWLERCGLEQRYVKGEWSWYKYGYDYYTELRRADIGYIFIHGYQPIKYLHQLQNLFFALTGFDLQIKSPQ